MEDDILSLEQTAMERWRDGDSLAFLELNAQEICYVDPGLSAPIIGLEAYHDYMAPLNGKIHYQGSEFIDPRLVFVGDAALLTFNYRSTILSPEGAVSDQTLWNCTDVYFRQAGAWRIVHNHWSYVKHKLPERVEVPVPVSAGVVKYDGLLGELMRLETAAMHRWDHGDPWGFIDLSAASVTYFDTGTPQRINGREALSTEYRQREGKISYEVMDFIDPWVTVQGELAVLFYRFFSTHMNPDGTIASRTPWNCTEVFQHFPEGWKIIHTHWSFICGERL